MKEVCTHELNVGPVILDPSNSNDGNSYFSIRYPDTVSPAYCAIYEKKSHLVMRMLERRNRQRTDASGDSNIFFLFYFLMTIYKLLLLLLLLQILLSKWSPRAQ